MWTSDREVDRAIAATWCHGCSIMVECGDAADELGETWYVFGGRDYGRRRKKKQAAA
jgi:hypothetical protein